ncbi:hypothetical protein ABZP36_027844 [Zizania latifolia]
MEVDMEAERGGGEEGHKRADPEKATEEPDSGGGGGDAKRPREGVHLRSFEMEEDEYDDEPLPNPLDSYRRSWISFYGDNGDSFEDETERLPMHNTDTPVLPTSAEPMDTMQVFTAKVTEITGGLRWPLAVYGLVAVRDSWDHKRNILFRRTRDDCQTLTSLQAGATANFNSSLLCDFMKIMTAML